MLVVAYSFTFTWIPEYLGLFLTGFWLTVQILLWAGVCSLLLGLLAGQGLTSNHRWVRAPVRLYVDFFRLTPLLLQILVIFFLVPVALGLTGVSALTSGIVALGLNYGAFNAEVFKAGISSVEKGQWEAAGAMGMGHVQVLRRVVYPQAVRRMLPPLGNMMVSLVKDTSLVSVIGVAELLNTSQTVGAATFQTIEALMFIALFYLIINVPLAQAATRLHERLVVRA